MQRSWPIITTTLAYVNVSWSSNIISMHQERRCWQCWQRRLNAVCNDATQANYLLKWKRFRLAKTICPGHPVRSSNFKRLVLGCIDADFCNQILVGKLLTRSTRFACFCTLGIHRSKLKSSQNFVKKSNNCCKINCATFCKFLSFTNKFTVFDQNLIKFARNFTNI